MGGTVEEVRHKDAVLRRWCEDVGRSSDDIERSLLPGVVVVRSSEAEARQYMQQIHPTNRSWDGEPGLVGTPDQIAGSLAPYLSLGFHNVLFDFPPPFDQETLQRLAVEVRPQLASALV